MSVDDILNIPLDFLKGLFESGWLYVVIGVLILILGYLVFFAK